MRTKDILLDGFIYRGGKEMDGMLELCVKQGYVPKDCKLNGNLVFTLISSGKNPCDGCNAICPHRIKKE